MDEKDLKLLKLLQENSRSSLKVLGKKIGLSIDSTKKRIDKLKKNEIISNFKIQVNPKRLGFDIVSDNKIKLKNITKKEKEKFISYLIKLPNCIELIAISGEFDFTCVLIAKNTESYYELIYEIREHFKEIIADWRSSFNLKIYKFEEYNLEGFYSN